MKMETLKKEDPSFYLKVEWAKKNKDFVERLFHLIIENSNSDFDAVYTSFMLASAIAHEKMKIKPSSALNTKANELRFETEKLSENWREMIILPISTGLIMALKCAMISRRESEKQKIKKAA